MAKKEKSFYQRLTRLFRSGPAIRRKIRGQDYKNFYDNQVVQNNLGYYGAAGFKREASPFSVMGAYGILDRMSRYAEFAEMENCLHGDTKIAVPGGYKTLKELTEEYGLEKEFVVYSYDHTKSAIVPAIARQARHTTTTHAYRVKFDNGKEIIGTEDHRLMKRDGTYCEIRDLKPGDAMMPFYRRSLMGKETGPELQENCYQLIYTMNKVDSPSRWISEHRLLGKFIAGRDLATNEVIHHKNFKAHDNRLENLELMTEEEHQSLHAKILNGKKWDKALNADWIAAFKQRHSVWMKENNPAERTDIKFERILQWCDENSYNLHAVARAFDTDLNTIKRKLKTKGFSDFRSFAMAYCTGWKPYNGKNKGTDNNRYRSDLTFEVICNTYTKGLTQKAIAKKLNVSVVPINARLKEHGYNTWSDFTETYQNLKVESIEYFGVTELYDITVDSYKNFATDSLIAHNTADIATALNVYADESCASDENGRTFHIYSDVPQVQRALEELFYDVMNIEFNARRMVRNLVKNGDYFMYVEVVPDYGVINVEPLPVNEVEREEGFDKHDPYAVRFRLITRGGKYLENWQMLHFRILGNDLFLPYGTSFLESARRPWRQLCHLSGTRVLTSTGYKNIEDIVAGETVYTHVPESKQTVKAKVKHVLDMGKQPIVSVETSHRTIKVTPNHGLLTLDKNGTFLYKKASDLVQSHGQGGVASRNADKLVLPALLSGNPSLQINFEDFANNYSVKLTKKASEIERKGIMRRLKQLGTATGYKNVHLFLNGSKKLSWSDYQLVCTEFGLTTPVEYYYRHSKKKSVFFGANNHSYELDKDFMKFFGFMLGDGWTKDNGFGFALGVYEQQNEEYIGYASKLFGNDYSLSKRKGTQSAQVNWSNTEVADVLRHLGFKTGFANKHIPDWVYALDLSARRALVQGMFDADGCDNTKTICFANKKLMEQTQELCWTIGIPTGKTISVRAEREGHKESYKLWLDLTKPSEEVVYENVVRVVQKEQGQTWDLEVDHEEHNFLANGVVTHNTMMEDSMLVYRLVRSPERRVFYVDVSAVHPNDIPSYMEAVKESMRGASVIEQQTGRQDFRYNPLAIDEDYFLPTRPNNQTKIESLAGGQNATAIEDVEYIHKKLIAALMVPKAYLTYDEAISSKATLAQEDIRFSRTVGQLQKILIAELNKLAMIHLYSLGFSGDDLLNFDIKFSNPSTVAVQQKLALIQSKLEIAGKALELGKETGLLSFNYIQTEILGLRPEQINIIKQEAKQDQVTMAELKKIAENPPFDKSIDSNIDIFDKSNYEVPTSPFAPDKKEVRKVEIQNQEEEQEYQAKRAREREEKSGNNSSAPIKFSPTPNLDKSFRKSRRSKAFTGDRALVMPDFKKMLDITNNRYSKDPFDTESIRKFVLEESEMEKDLFGKANRLPLGISREMQTSLRKLNEVLHPQKVVEAIEIVNEKANKDDDELFLIEKELKSE